MQKKSKLRKGCGWISLVCSIVFFISLTVLVLGCGSEPYDPRPSGDADMITPLGNRVWTQGHDVDPDGIDRIFLAVVEALVEALGYGQPPPFNLIIQPAHCREYPDGLTYCGFENPDFSFMLAGTFTPGNIIEIHLMNGEWPLEKSALGHEIDHYIKYWYGDDDWNVNDVKVTPAKQTIKEG